MTNLSLWWDTLPADLAAPLGTPLAADTTADVASVGAGCTGRWTAYYLARLDPKLRIVVVEAEQAGFGASGRNGGWASALFPVSRTTLARASSRDAAIRQHRAMIDSIAELDRVRQEEAWDIDWAHGGTLSAVFAKREDRCSDKPLGRCINFVNHRLDFFPNGFNLVMPGRKPF